MRPQIRRNHTNLSNGQKGYKMVLRLRSWWQNRSKLLLVVGAMVSRLRSWRQNRSRLLLVVGAMVLLVGVVVLIIAGYLFKWDWTGFNEQRGPNILQYQPAKTLWDWLQLLGVLAIPVAVVLGVAWFTTKQGQVSDAENKDNQREAALQAYIDNMLELLLAKNLRSSTEDEEVQKIARVRTLTVLRRLDAERKGSVLQFLQESGLIGKDKRVINLTGANLIGANLSGANLSGVYLSRADLSGADLSKANLSGVVLSGADLSLANLIGANLSGVYLSGADLSGVYLSGAYLFLANLSKANLSGAGLYEANLSLANLSKANLSGANLGKANLGGANLSEVVLSGANLNGANLSGADLSGANLRGALVTPEQLTATKLLQGVTMPDGSKHS